MIYIFNKVLVNIIREFKLDRDYYYLQIIIHYFTIIHRKIMFI